MANMSYVRWQNTLNALSDCGHSLLDPTGKMDDYERAARQNLFALVKKMAERISVMTENELEHGDPEFDEHGDLEDEEWADRLFDHMR